MLRRHLNRSKRNLLSANAWRVRLALWGGALLVGLLATFFASTSEHANSLFADMLKISPWLPLIVTPGGLILVAWLTQRFFQGSQGSGIPQALAALETPASEGLRQQVLSVRVAVGKIILTLLGLFSGASIGREGPTVHIGAAIMYNMGKWMRFPPHYMEKALILSGGAAGIAAAFNTPLAGVVFAIEEIARSFEERTNGIVVTAVIFAGMTSLVVLGNYNYFGVTSASLEHYTDWLAVPVCAVVGGLLGGLFSQILISGSKRLAPLMKRHPLLVAGACGLVVAIVGIASGGLGFGTGYNEAKSIVMMTGDVNPGYPFFKFLASVASYLSGIPGGIFAPSLATGAGLGADLSILFPNTPADAVVILGMVAYFAGVVQTPITSFVIVMEMTDNHGMLLPLMATAFIAHGVSRLVCHEPIYQALSRSFMSPATAEAAERRERELEELEEAAEAEADQGEVEKPS